MSDDGRLARVVLLDACALVPIRLTTTLLALAEAGLFEALWSEQILDEVERNLPAVGISPTAALRRVAAMRDGFGDAALVDGFADLIDTMACDAKDRHVLAAAVKGGADTIVTVNLKDFPAESTAVYGITAIHPDKFLTDLLVAYPDQVISALADVVADLERPAMTLHAFLASLTYVAPTFAHRAADAFATKADETATTSPPEPNPG